MTQAERADGRRRPDPDHHARTSAASCRAAAPPRRRTRPRRGPTWSTASSGSARHPARHPAALRRRLRARPRQPARRHGLPAQHRPRRDPRPAAWSAGRAHHRGGDPGHRPAVGLRAVRLRRPRRPVGPHLRELRRGPGPGHRRWRPRSTASRAAGRPRRPATACWPPPSTTPVTATPRTAPRDRRLQDRPGRRRSPIARTSGSIALRRTSRPSSEHHVGSVMPSFSSVDWTEDGVGNPLKMHAHKELITDVLKRRIGFDGFVISDWEAIHQIPGDYADPGPHVGQRRHRHVHGAARAHASSSRRCSAEVEAGRVPMSRINDAVRRILTAKFELGLFEHPYTDRTHIGEIGSPAHRAVARRAVAESQVLLKNRRTRCRCAPRASSTSPVQRRQHRQPGRRLDDHLAGRLDATRSPATTILDGHPERAGAAASPTARTPRRPSGGATSASWWSARRRTPRASATSAARVGFRPRRQRRPAPPDHELNAADKAAVDKVCAAAGSASCSSSPAAR